MRPRWWQLGLAIPGLMALALTVDLIGRLLPLELVAVRTWEAALRVTAGGPGPFEPNRVFRKGDAYGDLAALGNVWDLRQYRAEELVTDRYGFRNSTNWPLGFSGIVTGDSFVVATHLADAETLPSRLEQLAGGHFYNAGGIDPVDAAASARLADAVHVESGLLIFELLERRVRRGVTATIAAQSPTPPAVDFNLGSTIANGRLTATDRGDQSLQALPRRCLAAKPVSVSRTSPHPGKPARHAVSPRGCGFDA